MRRFRGKNLIVSYMTLRQSIGIAGMSLPVLCLFFGFVFADLPIQPSISAYYHSNVRDLFVGLLVCVGFFLITYKGYDPIDDVVTTLSGAAAFGTALFPCLSGVCLRRPVGMFRLPPAVSDKLHLASAVTFFVLLACNSLFLFTRTDKRKPKTNNKKWRNRIYRACGLAIFAFLLALAPIMILAKDEFIQETKIVFWIEFLMLLAFGISWITKGEAILKDPPGADRRRARNARRI